MSVRDEGKTHHYGDDCPGGHRAANVAGVNWDDQETAEEANARGASADDVAARLANLRGGGQPAKTDKPCTDPWCRGTGTSCGRTPQEHMEDGLTAEQFFIANPPPGQSTTSGRTCELGRGSDGPCEGLASFDLVTRSAGDGRELSREPGCLRHAMADADRAHAAGSIARVDVQPARAD